MPVNLTGKSQLAAFIRKNSLEPSEDPIKYFAYREYSRKQWGKSLEELPVYITNRVQSRNDYSVKFFTDKYVMRPRHGYTRMLLNTLGHPNIEVCRGNVVTLDDLKDELVVWTGYLSKEWLDLDGKRISQPEYRYLHTEVRWEPLDYTHVLNSSLKEDSWTRRMNCCRYDSSHKVGTLRRVPYLYEYPEAAPGLKGVVKYNEPMPGWIMPSKHKPYLIDSFCLVSALQCAYPNTVFAGRWGTNSYLNMDDCIESAIEAVNILLGRQHAGLRLCLENIPPVQGSSYQRYLGGYTLMLDSNEYAKDIIMYKS